VRTRGRGRGKDFLRLGVPFFYVCDTAALSCWLFVLLNCLTEALYAPRKRYLLPTLPVIPPDHKSSPLAALTRCYNGAYRFPPSGISRTIGSVPVFSKSDLKRSLFLGLEAGLWCGISAGSGFAWCTNLPSSHRSGYRLPRNRHSGQ